MDAPAPKLMIEATWRSRVFGAELTVVGRFVEGEPALSLRDDSGDHPLAAGGHDHFRAAASS